MENISLLKEKWFKKEVERLAKEGISKADISRALDIKPQYLNSVLNGSRGLADTFLDKFIEAYNINQFDLLPPSVDSNISSMSLRLMEKLDGKDAKIEQLQNELRSMSEELGKLKAQLEHYQPENKIHQLEAGDLGGKKTAKDASLKKHSSQNADDVTSVIVP